MSTITPLLDYVLIKPLEKQKETSFGLVLASSNADSAPTMGEVVAIGPGKMENGQLSQASFSVGDTVIFSRYAGDDVEHEGVKYKIISFDHVKATVKA